MAITITVKKEPDKSKIEVYRQFFEEDGEKKLDELIAKAIVNGGKNGTQIQRSDNRDNGHVPQ